MKITVNRLKLIAAITKRIEDEKEKYKKEQAQYAAKFEKARTRLIENLSREAKALANAVAIPDDYEFRKKLFNGVSAPREPKLDTNSFEAALTRLSLCTDETITLTEKDDYFRYV